MSEYIPTEAEQAADPAEDSKENSNYLAPALRKKARRCKELSDGSKVLFDELTDASFVKSMSKGPGVILVSKSKLARELKISRKTVDRRTKELEQTGFIWTRTEFIGGYELTLWFIREMASSQSELFYYANPRFGTSKAQERKERRRQPARNAKGKFIKVPKPAEPPESPSAPYGQICPSGENPANGHVCPDPTDKVDRSPRSDLTVVHGQDCPSSTDKVDRSHRTKVSDKGSLETITQGKDSITINRLKGNRPGGKAFPELTPRQKASENDFLAQLKEVVGKVEVETNGGGWRQRFRQDKSKLWSYLAEVRSMKTEGRLETTPAQTMNFLWCNGWGKGRAAA